MARESTSLIKTNNSKVHYEPDAKNETSRELSPQFAFRPDFYFGT
jgi:hypothetical protein